MSVTILRDIELHEFIHELQFMMDHNAPIACKIEKSRSNSGVDVRFISEDGENMLILSAYNLKAQQMFREKQIIERVTVTGVLRDKMIRAGIQESEMVRSFTGNDRNKEGRDWITELKDVFGIPSYITCHSNEEVIFSEKKKEEIGVVKNADEIDEGPAPMGIPSKAPVAIDQDIPF